METETITKKIIWEVVVYQGGSTGVIGESPIARRLFENESDADKFISNPPENLRRDRMYKKKVYLK